MTGSLFSGYRQSCFLFNIFANLSLKFVLFLTSISVSSILILILTFSGNVFIIVFYVNGKYILLAFSFLLLSCGKKNHFVVNGSQTYTLILLIIIILIKVIVSFQVSSCLANSAYTKRNGKVADVGQKRSC